MSPALHNKNLICQRNSSGDVTVADLVTGSLGSQGV